MRATLRSVSAGMTFVLCLGGGSVLASAVGACSSDGEGTTGKRLALTAKVTASAGATVPFTNAMGWSVQLTKAFVATGALYYYDGAPIFSRVEPRLLDRVRALVAVPVAFAHPGHYVPGNALGEWLSPSSVDLRAPSVLGVGQGVTGVARSGSFSFATPASGPFAAELGSHVAVLEGTGTKDGVIRAFRAEIDAADVANTEGLPAVEGCPFVETSLERDGVVTVELEVERWFDQVEFDSLPETPDGAPKVMPADAIGRNELVRGMKEGIGYAFSFAPPAGP